MNDERWEDMAAMDRRHELMTDALFWMGMLCGACAVALTCWAVWNEVSAERHVCPLCGAAHRIETKGDMK